MKPFNRERALAGDPVVTREGTTPEQLRHNAQAFDGQSLSAWVNGKVYTWYANGKYLKGRSSRFDLFMAPRKV